MIDSLNDPERMRNDGVRASSAKIICGKALENLVREAVGGGEREF